MATRASMAAQKQLVRIVACAAALATSGCVEQLLTITSEPQGALVSLNDKEFGRTPVTRDFTWYGKYDVELRREGYESMRTTGQVTAVWWNWIPLDLIVQLLPVNLVDHRQLHYTLKPERGLNDLAGLTRRGRTLGEKLGPEAPATRPATSRPTTKPSR